MFGERHQLVHFNSSVRVSISVLQIQHEIFHLAAYIKNALQTSCLHWKKKTLTILWTWMLKICIFSVQISSRRLPSANTASTSAFLFLFLSFLRFLCQFSCCEKSYIGGHMSLFCLVWSLCQCSVTFQCTAARCAWKGLFGAPVSCRTTKTLTIEMSKAVAIIQVVENYLHVNVCI